MQEVMRGLCQTEVGLNYRWGSGVEEETAGAEGEVRTEAEEDVGRGGV